VLKSAENLVRLKTLPLEWFRAARFQHLPETVSERRPAAQSVAAVLDILCHAFIL